MKRIIFLSIAALNTISNLKASDYIHRINMNPDFKSPFIPQPKQVAVIDSGFDKENPELRKYLDIQKSFSTKTYQNKSSSNSELIDPSSISDPRLKDCGRISSHGTHVSGIVLQAFGKDCYEELHPDFKLIIPIKVSQNECNIEKFVFALNKIKDDNSISVINLSWGFANKKHQIPESLKNIMLDVMNTGKIIVLSAGNNRALYNKNIYTKSIYNLAQRSNGRLLVVGATDYEDGKEIMAEFSAISDKKMAPYFISAPGVDIQSFMPICEYKPGIGEKSGTSMAAPIVSGVLARLISDFPLLGPDEIVKILKDTAQTQYHKSGKAYKRFGCGIINVELARNKAIEIYRERFPDDLDLSTYDIIEKPKVIIVEQIICPTHKNNGNRISKIWHILPFHNG